MRGGSLTPGDAGGVTGAFVATEEPGGGDTGERNENLELLKSILTKLKYLEAFVKSTGNHEATTRAAKRQRGGLAGYRTGVAPTVGFDKTAMKALPLCSKCSVGGKQVYHLYKDCEHGGRRHAPGTAAAYCQPAAEVTKEDSEHAALAFRFQQAADQGAEAFAAAAETYGAPELLSGEQAGGLDVSAYGFGVPEQAAEDERDLRDPQLVRLSREGEEAAARCGLPSFTQVSVPAPGPGGAHTGGEGHLESMLAATQHGGAGVDAVMPEPAVHVTEPTGEFTGAVTIDATEAEPEVQQNGEEKQTERRAVVPLRWHDRVAAAQPMGCGTPPFGASQRLMWTVCMLGMFLCVAGALRGTGELGSAGGGPAHVAGAFFTDEHGRVWYYPEPVEITFGMHDVDGWEHRLQEAVDVLMARVRDVLPSGGGAAADGGALAAGGAHVYGDPPFDVAEDYEEAAVLGDYEDEYEY
ncbi:hypothetical protein CYMTET_21387 [Cymbomonas tetramitiformis]|uniref:Uncharacterized protein n=1 Tax=Cymbomonas tetramitiformis TaxID=36881 RepID=A0AAE0G288_9CHLO|nr:hypothetical protein CYMTET_21387 [Cymbomonas tetramitiformis]